MTPQEVYDRALADPDCDMKEYLGFMRHFARGNILEIGVRYGVSTSAFLLGIEKNGGHLYSVDIDLECGKLFNRPEWTFLCADSQSPRALDGPDWNDARGFDLILIDGDHKPEAVRHDLRQFAPLLRRNGMLLVHDVIPQPNITPEMEAQNWPTAAVGEEFARFAKESGWLNFIIAGKFGMGVLIRE